MRNADELHVRGGPLLLALAVRVSLRFSRPTGQVDGLLDPKALRLPSLRMPADVATRHFEPVRAEFDHDHVVREIREEPALHILR